MGLCEALYAKKSQSDLCVVYGLLRSAQVCVQGVQRGQHQQKLLHQVPESHDRHCDAYAWRSFHGVCQQAGVMVSGHQARTIVEFDTVPVHLLCEPPRHAKIGCGE